MRSRWGLSPKSPQNAAGMRIEPAPSEPSATPHRPAAAAAPDPPLDPPGVWSSDHGLRVAPRGSFWPGPAVGERAVRGDLAGNVDAVLDRDWDAEERTTPACPPARVGLMGLDQRPSREHD